MDGTTAPPTDRTPSSHGGPARRPPVADTHRDPKTTLPRSGQTAFGVEHRDPLIRASGRALEKRTRHVPFRRYALMPCRAKAGFLSRKAECANRTPWDRV